MDFDAGKEGELYSWPQSQQRLCRQRRTRECSISSPGDSWLAAFRCQMHVCHPASFFRLSWILTPVNMLSNLDVRTLQRWGNAHIDNWKLEQFCELSKTCLEDVKNFVMPRTGGIALVKERGNGAHVPLLYVAKSMCSQVTVHPAIIVPTSEMRPQQLA